MGPPQGRVEGEENLPRPAAHTPPHAPQDPTALLGTQGTLLAHLTAAIPDGSSAAGLSRILWPWDIFLGAGNGSQRFRGCRAAWGHPSRRGTQGVPACGAVHDRSPALAWQPRSLVRAGAAAAPAPGCAQCPGPPSRCPPAAPAPPAAWPSALCSLIAADRDLKWSLSAQRGRGGAGWPQPQRCRGARAAPLAGRQARGGLSDTSPSPAASSWVISGLRGIGCMAPTARAAHPGAGTSPGPAPSILPTGREGAGSAPLAPAVGAGRAPRLSQCWWRERPCHTIATGWGAGGALPPSPAPRPHRWHPAGGGRGGDAAEERFVGRCTLQARLQRRSLIPLPRSRLTAPHHVLSPPNSPARMPLLLQGGSFCSSALSSTINKGRFAGLQVHGIVHVPGTVTYRAPGAPTAPAPLSSDVMEVRSRRSVGREPGSPRTCAAGEKPWEQVTARHSREAFNIISRARLVSVTRRSVSLPICSLETCCFVCKEGCWTPRRCLKYLIADKSTPAAAIACPAAPRGPGTWRRRRSPRPGGERGAGWGWHGQGSPWHRGHEAGRGPVPAGQARTPPRRGLTSASGGGTLPPSLRSPSPRFDAWQGRFREPPLRRGSGWEH